MSVSATDLHTSVAFLDNAGTPVASVTDDYDGEPRSLTAPDIGADESTALAPLAGTYTIGAGGTYPTFAAATSDLTMRGVSGPVTFQVGSGTYTEQVALTTPGGASSTNRIVFRSQSGNAADVTLRFATSSAPGLL